MTKTYQKTCIGCKKEFETGYSWQKTCSSACQKRVRYRKKHDLPVAGKLKTRKQQRNVEKICIYCQKPFTAFQQRTKFCSDSCGVMWRYYQENTVPRERICKNCQKPFTYQHRSRAWYCSDECARIAAIKSRVENARISAQWQKDHPEEVKKHRKARKEYDPVGYSSGITQRFFKKYPHIQPICQACGEKRVVELAHKKPRNGAWRTFKNTTDKDVWILCPTCHRCLDFGIQTREELGLPE